MARGKMSLARTKQTSSKTAPKSASTGPGGLSAPSNSTTRRGITPFPSGDNAANIPSGLEDAMLRSDKSITDMGKRLKQFNGPWQKMVGAADDDNSLA